MATIKCKECGKEMSDTLNNCSNCGYPLKSNIKNKQLIIGKNKQLIIGISFIVLGIISIIWGLIITYNGIPSISEIYGGDAYTGIQNAASITANNINELGNTLCVGLKGILIVMGGAIIIYGTSIVLKEEGK